MATAILKTKKTQLSVGDFIGKIPDLKKQKDARAIVAMMEKTTSAKAKLWGSSIIGFGDTHLVYESGRELDWFLIGFSPRKQNFALYLPGAVTEQTDTLKKLGKYTTGKGCLYIQSLADINMSMLQKIIDVSFKKSHSIRHS